MDFIGNRGYLFRFYDDFSKTIFLTQEEVAEEFLKSVEDAEIRLIIRLRIVNNMSFESTGKKL